MSKTEDNTPIDNELKAYLAGEDGVSATYRQAGAEEPPAELDQLILAAARNAVQKDTSHKTTNLKQRFSFAASFMVGVLVTSMYFNREGNFAETTTTSAVMEEQVIPQSVEQPASVFAPAAPVVTTGDAQPEPLTQEVSQQAIRLGEQVARAVAPAPLERQEASQSKAEADTGIADNSSAVRGITADTNSEARENADPAVEAEVGVTAGLAPPSAEATGADVAGARLEEIMVTGSRIRRDTAIDLSYRQTREEWLMQILALREEAIGEEKRLEEINGQLDEEVELFFETYPDFDLDAELRALEE